VVFDVQRASLCTRNRIGVLCAGSQSEGCAAYGASGGAFKGNWNALKRGEFIAKSADFKKEITALTRMADQRSRLRPPVQGAVSQDLSVCPKTSCGIA
jgi:hypothetical protein